MSIVDKIMKSIELCDFETSETRNEARSAAIDAISFIDRHQLSDASYVGVNDDGVINVAWTGDHTTVLIFVGDGSVDYAIREGDGKYSYATAYYMITDEMPDELTRRFEWCREKEE